MRQLFLIIMLINAFGTFGQVIRGKVIGSDTRQGLPYVHIGVVGKNIGVISRENGAFEINLNSVNKADSLTFSSIGYQPCHLKISELNSLITVTMKPAIIQLNAVTVTDVRKRERRTLGPTKFTKTTSGQSGKELYGFGEEKGIQLIHPGGTLKIVDINFRLRWNTLDSILFRVNVYHFQEGKPGASLLHEPIIITAHRGDKWIRADIRDHQVFITEDVFVSIEILQRWFHKTGSNMLYFSHRKGYDESTFLRRQVSQGPWTSDFAIPLTLYVTAEQF